MPLFSDRLLLEQVLMAKNEEVLLEALCLLNVTKVIVEYFGEHGVNSDSWIGFVTVSNRADDNNVALKLAGSRLVTINLVRSVLKFGDSRAEWIRETVVNSIDLYSAILKYCDTWLEIEHPRYADDAGGQGTMTISPFTGEFMLSHTNRTWILHSIVSTRMSKGGK